MVSDAQTDIFAADCDEINDIPNFSRLTYREQREINDPFIWGTFCDGQIDRLKSHSARTGEGEYDRTDVFAKS